MAKLKVCLVFAILLGLMSACEASDTKLFDGCSWRVGEKSNLEFSDTLEFALKDGTQTVAGAAFEIINPTKMVYCCGTEYAFEIHLDGVWYQINGGPKDFVAEEYRIAPGETKEVRCYGYGELAPGTYRVVKEMYPEDMDDAKFYICCEFTVE